MTNDTAATTSSSTSLAGMVQQLAEQVERLALAVRQR